MITVSAGMREKINEAIKAFHDLTCLKIKPRSEAGNLPHNTFVYFVNGYVLSTLISILEIVCHAVTCTCTSVARKNVMT
jgi:hypothetical protein